MSDQRPLGELTSSGLLWLINTTVFHPRGYAMQLHLDAHGDATGWSLIGDGKEPFMFAQGEDRQIDDAFRRATETLSGSHDQ